MNCLDFHRAKLADPRLLAPEAQAHAAQCAACNAFAKSVDEAERDLERSLAVSVPEGLADRVLLRVRSGQPDWRRRSLLAAGVAAVSVGGLTLLYNKPIPAGRYAADAIDHVAGEPSALVTVQRDPRDLGELVRAAGGKLKEPLGETRYVKLCPVDDGSGWHIVFNTPQGLATLFIVPGKALSGAEYASSGEWNALARPMRAGYYAVVTPSAKKTEYVDRIVRERIDWNA